MTLHLSHPIDTRVLAAMLDDGAFDPAADWLMTNVPDPADVLLLYARDKGACEGLEQTCRCPACLGVGGRSRNGDGLIICALCGHTAPDGSFGYCPEQLLPTDFPQAALAAWAGEKTALAIQSFRVTECSPYTARLRGGMWCCYQLRLPNIMHDEVFHRTNGGAVRDMKRRTLRLFTEVVRIIRVRHSDMRVGTLASDYGFVFYPGSPDLVDTDDGFTQQTWRAEDFVPPEPTGYRYPRAGESFVPAI